MEEEKIIEPIGCFVCGKNSDGYTYCVDCGADKYLEGDNEADPIAYVKKKNPERFNMIMKWYEQQKKETTGNVTGSL